MTRNFFWGIVELKCSEIAPLIIGKTPGTVLPRSHPNAGTDGDAAENIPLEAFDFESKPGEAGCTHGSGPPNFIYEIETL